MIRLPRLTARLRLTLLYGALFLAAGIVLLGLSYALMRRSLDNSPDFFVSSELLQEILPVPATPDPQPPPDDRPLQPGFEIPIAVEQEQQRLREATLHELLIQSSLALAVMTVASAGLGWWFAGRALRPVHDITAVARRLSEESLHERIALTGPNDELKELADTFDDMLTRLETAFDSQRRFVANASHELRTPLAIARTEIDVTLADPEATPTDLRAMGETVRDATARSERLIDGLLILARSTQTIETREPLDLADAAQRALAQVRPEAESLHLQEDTELQPAMTTGDRPLLERLVANLVENAVRHNVADGWLKITTETTDDSARLIVANGGPVIPPDDVETLFEPFQRRGQARTGSDRGAGLGLSIVRAIASAHDGTAVARALPDGGLEVVVDLPESSEADERSAVPDKAGPMSQRS